jgi:acylphosphatase
MPDQQTIAVRVHYAGQVQGVGFRATAAHIARAYQVTGWVRNLPDGRVELWAEGESAEVEAFLQAVRRQWRSTLTGEQREPQPPVGRYRAFDITR